LYAYALLISAILALILGNILSATITVPMRNLTVQAKKLADGDMNALEPSNAHDEFGNLTNSLVYLAHTRQESTDRALSEKTKVETILQNMTDGILAFDLHGKLIHFNPEAQRLLDRKYLDDIQFDRFFKEINANITLGDLLYMKPDGLLEREIKLKNQYLRLNFATFSVDNKIGGIIVVIHDVTRQEKLEQSRRDFVANVSHELRTPLTTIKSYSETLSDMPDVDRELQVRFLDVIASEADRMARIISDLLTLSELDENQTYYKTPEEINIRKMLENIVERMGMTAKKKNQTLTYHPINETPIISGDRDSLERVIINIVSNALKYTGEGGNIEVYSSKVYKDICIKVSDNGIGIQKDKLPHIFDRFYRVDKARSRDTGGTGLGLAIAKQSIESAFNGKIKISSEFNKGTEVTITIPVNN
jgi:two-component system sensor histidine kinase VicK